MPCGRSFPHKTVRVRSTTQQCYRHLPDVTRFFWPPLMPRSSWSPTMVSMHTSSPKSFTTKSTMILFF